MISSKRAGISLVALVVTIIVLIILTGAVIATFTEGGIIEKAKEEVMKKTDTEEKEEWKDKWLSTPWSDIEVGMGLMKGLPILLVTDSEITDGVFDLQLSECYVANIPTNYDCKKIEQNPQFDEWLSKL